MLFGAGTCPRDRTFYSRNQRTFSHPLPPFTIQRDTKGNGQGGSHGVCQMAKLISSANRSERFLFSSCYRNWTSHRLQSTLQDSFWQLRSGTSRDESNKYNGTPYHWMHLSPIDRRQRLSAFEFIFKACDYAT